MDDDHAIVVGIDRYPGDGMTDLGGPCADATAFSAWLTDPVGGAVPPAQARLLRSSDFPPPAGVGDAHPMVSEITELFRPLVRATLDGRVGRRLYLFLAGHGFSDASDMNSAALYTAEAELMLVCHVAGTAYASWFRRQAAFDEIVLVMDCCRSHVLLHTISPPPLPALSVADPGRAGAVRTFFAYGASWGAVARERDFDGETRGIFTTALLDALQRAHPNAVGRVTGSVVKNYIHNVIDQVAGGAAVGPPDIQVDDRREVVFAERPERGDVEVAVTLSPHAGGERLIVSDGRGHAVLRIDDPGSPVTLELAPGLYKIAVAGTDRSALFEALGRHVDVVL